MNAEKFVFSQVMDLIHPEQFRRCVRRYSGDYKVKTFTCWNQFLCMAFGQLRSRQEQLYHLGFHGPISHSTLADANHNRDWRIYADLAQGLIKRARALYQNESLCIDLDETVYALDSPTIDLCLNLFPWLAFVEPKR